MSATEVVVDGLVVVVVVVDGLVVVVVVLGGVVVVELDGLVVVVVVLGGVDELVDREVGTVLDVVERCVVVGSDSSAEALAPVSATEVVVDGLVVVVVVVLGVVVVVVVVVDSTTKRLVVVVVGSDSSADALGPEPTTEDIVVVVVVVVDSGSGSRLTRPMSHHDAEDAEAADKVNGTVSIDSGSTSESTSSRASFSAVGTRPTGKVVASNQR